MPQSTRELNSTGRHRPLPTRLLIGIGQANNHTTDAHLSAIAIEHGATLGRFDRDFEHSPSLQLELRRHE